MADTLETSATPAEQYAERMAIGYALLTGEEAVDETTKASIEMNLLKTGLELVVELKRRPPEYIPTATETAGWTFTAAILGNVTKRRVGVLDGEAYSFGQKLLDALVWDGRPLPVSVQAKLQGKG